MIKKDDYIYITGSTGFVGKRVKKKLEELGYTRLVEGDLDLKDSGATDEFFRTNRPDYVIHLAARVGGISANKKDNLGFFLDNLKINVNVFESAFKYAVKGMLNLGSSCMYPKDHPVQPMAEEELMGGPLEPTNLGYALAKICGQKIGEMGNKQTRTKTVTLSPCNLYGPGDHFGKEDSHALAALVYKVATAFISGEPKVSVWGSGNQRREWLYVDDLVDAVIWGAENLTSTETFLNVGTGVDISMNELAQLIGLKLNQMVDDGRLCLPKVSIEIENDTSKPDGMLVKLTDPSKINQLGWKFKTNLEEGIEKTLEWFFSTHYSHFLRGNK